MIVRSFLLMLFFSAIASMAGPFAEVAKTEHFELRTFEGKDSVLSLYGRDVLEKAYDRIGKNIGARPSKPIPVEFYPSWKAFIEVSTLTEAEVRTTGTIALCKFGKLMLTTPRALAHGYSWMDTLAHEYTHFVISLATADRTPVWLHEGIAKYEEIRWREEVGGELPRESQALLQKRMAKKTLIPFDQFHPSIAKLKTAEDAAVAFAEAFYFVKYLIESQGGYETLRSVLGLIREGLDAKEAIARVEGKSFDQVYAAWLGWLTMQNLPVDPSVRAKEAELKDSDTLVTDALSEMEGTGRGRDFVVLGDLLREQRRYVAAMIEYEKAKGAFPSASAALLNRIADVAISAKDNERAMTALNEAAAVETDYPTTFIRRAELFMAKGDTPSAKSDLLWALSINPFDPRIHQGLLEIAKKKKDSDLQSRSETILRSLSPVK